MTVLPARHGRVVRAGLIGAILTGCASSGGMAESDSPGPPPDLSGHRVMLLPVQPHLPRVDVVVDSAGGAIQRVDGARLDAELAYWLSERGTQVSWVFPDALSRALRRTPTFRVPLASLPVGGIGGGAEAIRDPLYGHLRSLGALVDVRYALIPVAAGYVPGGSEPGRVHISMALVDTIGGAILWFARLPGAAGEASDPAASATAAQAVARVLFP